jgi:hypothetical protein
VVPVPGVVALAPNVEENKMDNNQPSSALIAAERAALEQRLCRFIADESADFARRYGVIVNSIKTDVLPLRSNGTGANSSFVSSVHVGITEP